MSDTAQSAAEVETPASFGKDPAGLVKRWQREIELSSKAEEDWRKSSDKIVKRYRGEGNKTEDGKPAPDSYNLLYANVQTIGPILYNSTPEPVVERRFGDDDPIAKAASEVLRRAIKYTVGCQDFDEVLALAVQDYQLPGRAVVSVQYVPTLAPAVQSAEQGATEKTEELIYEEVRYDLTNWKDFRRGPGSTWQDVPWVAFMLKPTRAQCVELFGPQIGAAVPLRGANDEESQKDQTEQEQIFQRAIVWVVWDKDARQVLWICPDYPRSPCKVEGDQYNLTSFFNIPRPLYAVETSDSLVPVSEFTLYESLADEAEVIVKRLAKLARAIRVRGGYDSNLPELEQMLEEGSDAKLIPIKNAEEWRENGGLAGAVFMWPIEMLVNTYTALAAQLDRIKGEIYEILGVADIMRGASDPDETMGAQAIKERWGSLRTRRRQSEVQRFCRDLFRITAELISEKFSQQSLAAMTNLKYPTQAEKMQAQAMMQQAQANPQMAQQAGPEAAAQVQQTLASPSWEEIIAFLRSDAMRHFRIDVQTDSTIALQDGEDQADYAAMLGGVSELFGTLQPLVEKQIIPFDAAKALVLGLVRKFRMGYDIEDKFAQMKQPPAPDPMQDPKVIVEKAKAEAKLASDTQIAAAKAQAETQVQEARTQADVTIEQHKVDSHARLAEIEASYKAQLEQQKLNNAKDQALAVARIEAAAKIEVARITAGIADGANLEAALDEALGMPEAIDKPAKKPNPGHQLLQALVDHVAAANGPKRIVRDETGRAIGVEPMHRSVQ